VSERLEQERQRELEEDERRDRRQRHGPAIPTRLELPPADREGAVLSVLMRRFPWLTRQACELVAVEIEDAIATGI
jgi:hypothetical protein